MSQSTRKSSQPNITVVHGLLPDYSKDPFVIEKLEQARAFIAKNGRPNIARSKKPKWPLC